MVRVRHGAFIMNECLHCHKVLVMYTKWHKKVYCDNQCQQDYRYRQFVDRWLSGKVGGGRIGGYVSNHVRRYLIEVHGEKCGVCSWSEVNPFTKSIPVEVDHIDGCTTNNKFDNLRLLCPNCHSLTQFHKGANAGRGRVSLGIHASFKQQVVGSIPIAG